MSARHRISVAMIVLNEARHLRDLLPQLDWADEVVIVDGGSTDDSVSVATAAGCRVMRRPFDDFARQRNVALRMTRGDWVFSIDADERPNASLVQEIRRAVRSPRHDAWRIPIRSSIFGRRLRFSGTQHDAPVRLFRRDASVWHGKVHEVLHVTGRIGRLRGPLDHETLPDMASFIEKMNRYTTLEAQARAASRQAPAWHGQWLDPAREVFRRLIWKQGCWDGPEGWAFCLLSGWSAWTAWSKHKQLGQPTSTSHSAHRRTFPARSRWFGQVSTTTTASSANSTYPTMRHGRA